jgi:hypothetical protein
MRHPNRRTLEATEVGKCGPRSHSSPPQQFRGRAAIAARPLNCARPAQEEAIRPLCGKARTGGAQGTQCARSLGQVVVRPG